MGEVEDFVRRYPNGVDRQVSHVFYTRRPATFIPQLWERALEIEALVLLAKVTGYPEEVQTRIREMLGPTEPHLVSLDDLYGSGEEDVC